MFVLKNCVFYSRAVYKTVVTFSHLLICDFISLYFFLFHIVYIPIIDTSRSDYLEEYKASTDFKIGGLQKI
jgi:hypothetical protein